MRARRMHIWAIGVLLVLLGCETPTPPPPVSPTIPVSPTPTQTPVPPTPLPPAWPAQRRVFEYLEKIWVVEGAAPYALTPGRSPALAPEGERIAYLLPDPADPGRVDVYVFALSTGQFTRLTQHSGPYGAPVWSPDGQRVAFTLGSILIVSPAAGGEERVLAQDIAPGARIAWSSDGTALVCPLVREGETDLYAVQLSDGTATRLTHVGAFPAAGTFLVLDRETPSLPRDHVLFVHPGEGGTLWSVGLDGAQRERFLPEPDHVTGDLALSPDGRYLAGLREGTPETGYELWTVDLASGEWAAVATLQQSPLLLWWDGVSGELYWLDGEAFVHYAPGGAGVRVAGRLPTPTPVPTATPLPVPERLVYYHDAAFYQVQAYVGRVGVKEIPSTYAGAQSVVLHRGVVAFVLGPDVYTLQLEGGVPRLLYTFQQEGLLGLQVAWSREGTALLYAAAYRQAESSFGVRVDLGLLEIAGPAVVRFASITDWSGAVPLAYDESSGQAIVLPRGQDPAFVALHAYDVRSGQLSRIYVVDGEGTAAVSWDQHWAVVTGYDRESGRAFLRLYDLQTPEAPPQTAFLPEGLYCWGPLAWSPDDRYLAFVPLRGDPFGAPEAVPEGIWLLVPETMEAFPIASVDTPQALLVGWR